MSIEMRGNVVTVLGVEYDIPEKWWNPEIATGKIKELILTDNAGDPYMNKKLGVPYAFTRPDALADFVNKRENHDSVRVFVMDWVFANGVNRKLPVAELCIYEVCKLRGGEKSSVFRFTQMELEEAA